MERDPVPELDDVRERDDLEIQNEIRRYTIELRNAMQAINFKIRYDNKVSTQNHCTNESEHDQVPWNLPSRPKILGISIKSIKP